PIGMGPPGGFGGFAGQTQNTGLPFAGIPPEYAEHVDALLADEEETPIPDVDFDQVDPDERPFTLRSFLIPYRFRFAVAVLLIGFEAMLLQLGPWLLQIGIDHGVYRSNFTVLQVVVGVYFAAIAGHFFVARRRIQFTGRLGQQLMKGLRVKLFTHLQRLSLDFYTREKAGRIMARMTSDLPAMEQLIQEGIISLATQAMTLVVVSGFLFSMDIRLTLVVLIGVVPAMVALTLWFHRNSSKRYEAARERIADVLADLQESLSGVRIIALNNRQDFNIRRHRAVIEDYKDTNLSAARVAAVYGPAANFVGSLGQIAVLIIGGYMVYSGEISVGKVSAFVLYISAFFAPIQQLVQLHNTYQQGQAAVGKIRGVFDTKPSVPESSGARDLPDFTIRSVETYALVGQTGAGTSTIAKLVTRFYDPQEGRVLVDGHDLVDLRFDSLRRQLGVVPQEPFLFAGTIRENIAFARPDASDEQVVEACRKVGIEGLLDRLPQGIDTPCHERGVTLSSGERQLIALARAFLAQPRVLILDEATSNLDLKTESLIERALDTLLEGRTAILIAHRLSTAMRARRIAVVAEGRIVEIGSHTELLERGGPYALLFETWQRHGGHSRESPADQA
ncbi:MAG: ABC transporter ATP-binding protein, partial [Deltaproteobacteria bacterium]|nr:ABC transporter ATP-binding protein [Deltaproteobacteria bacterium]